MTPPRILDECKALAGVMPALTLDEALGDRPAAMNARPVQIVMREPARLF